MSPSTRARALRRALLGADALLLLGTALRATPARAKAPTGHFADNGDGTLTDSRTGLVWQRVVAPYAAFHGADQAAAFCAAPADLPGSGWRLPTVKELLTLMDQNAADTLFLDPSTFPKTADGYSFWTSTVCKVGQACSNGADLPFVVNFEYGQVGLGGGPYLAICVRSP
jgi:hypothetical protein